MKKTYTSTVNVLSGIWIGPEDYTYEYNTLQKTGRIISETGGVLLELSGTTSIPCGSTAGSTFRL